ncbi:hypothetical protein TNCV_1921371 [Trichonephila clavipes]|nr:hypothetical protein TNCV_1921371 [Trichonephila clavipes]
MSSMDADPPTMNESPCFQRQLITRNISTEIMLINTFQDLLAKFHATDPRRTETSTTSIAENQSKLDVLVKTPANTTPPKNKKKFTKRKLKKDSVEDFVFTKKTARPASPTIREPVATNNSFSDLEEDKDQVVEEEAKIAEVPKLWKSQKM